MSDDDSSNPHGDPLAQLERAFIEEYLHGRGQHLNTLKALPREQANALMKEASAYASGRLTEVETRAHLVDDLHDASAPLNVKNPRHAAG
ncbi:MAG TPA: hypothetical protein VM140_08185 [Burkholderiales bacterium]|nr:hypothetical protein [Burkholderiales bacterium]